jgi:Na+-driven multidrug efflux pump
MFPLYTVANVFLAIHSAVMALLYAFGYTKLSFYVNFARLFVFRIPILLFFQHCTTLAGGQAMGLVMMISNGMTGLLALVVAAAVLHKEYGAGWMKQLLST